MKLLSLNMEGKKHIDLIEPFISHEEADVVCLQEAPEGYQEPLQEHGYRTTFAPVLIRDNQGPAFTEGIILASRHPVTFSTDYYRHSAEQVVVEEKRGSNGTAHPVVFGEITFENTIYCIATTHVMVTTDSAANDEQSKGVAKMLSILESKPPHVLCGDFNIPRGYNENYNVITKRYIDAIPKTYTSSLDRELYRKVHPDGSAVEQHIFDDYLVDYIFTKAPYQASNVQLKFGVSDHAAVLAEITKTR